MTATPLELTLDRSLALLRRTPAALDALPRSLPDAWTRRWEGEGTWSVFDVIRHLIHCERTDWLPRARHLLEFRAFSLLLWCGQVGSVWLFFNGTATPK